MARPKKDQSVDLTEPQDLSAGLIDRLNCPAGKQQAFLRDSRTPGLRVRVTAAGAKSFVFEAKMNRQTIRRTIGDVRTWSIEQARTESRRIAVMLDVGHDPRKVAQDLQKAISDERTMAVAHAVVVAVAWSEYLEARQPRWGERHYREHMLLSSAGGIPSSRARTGLTAPGILYPLMVMPLRDLTATVIEEWATRETLTRPAAARLAWRCLKAFLGWCSEQPRYASIVTNSNPAGAKRVRESLGKPGVKQDTLLKEQLPAWFQAVRNTANPVISAYIQILLLTGARAGELLGLRWSDVNVKWCGLTIRDKVEGTRVIPLTPYVAQLMESLPRRNEFVFSSALSAGGAVVIPRNPHNDACRVAGIEHLTIHGLRRSFKSLTEWLDIPAGIVAQIMGHKPSATAEKHYTIRPLDLLRVHHQKIETWILEQAGVEFDQPLGGVRLVA